jgi:ribosomal protein S18 acetylase RimI-like enzyme
MTRPHTIATTIRTAGPDDAPAVAEVLATAFLHGDLAPWLIPNPAVRARVYRPYFALLTEQALHHGHVDITTERDAAAVWYPIAGDAPPAPRRYDERLADITGEYLPRFAALDTAMHRHHSYEVWHHYLAFLAVHPDRQRCGVGSALLAHHHADLDAHGTPAHLEATGVRNRYLYQRHGYRSLPPYRIATKSPRLYPMWRSPQPVADHTAAEPVNLRRITPRGGCHA